MLPCGSFWSPWFAWFQEALELFRSLQLPLLETTALLLESGAYLGAQDFDRSQKLGCISGGSMASGPSSGAGGVDDDGWELTCDTPLHKRLHSTNQFALVSSPVVRFQRFFANCILLESRLICFFSASGKTQQPCGTWLSSAEKNHCDMCDTSKPCENTNT